MSLQYTPYVIPVFAAAAISIWLAIWGWRRRPAPGASWFVVLMAALTCWSVGYVLEVVSTDAPTIILGAKIEYPGIVVVPVAWLMLVRAYTGQTRWLTWQRVAPLFVIPLITLIVTWTNELHGWLWSQTTLDTGVPFVAVTYGRGPWYFVNVGYAYMLLLLGTLLLIRELARPTPLYRGQAIALLVGSLAPWVVNLIYMLRISPSGLDLTPFAFIVAGLAAAWGLHRWRLLDIVPVAQAAIIENIDDGIIVLDRQNRVVDINPVAQRVVGQKADEVIGHSIAEVMPEHADVIDHYQESKGMGTEITIIDEARQRHFDLRLSPLKDGQGALAGQLVVLRDVTEHRRVEQELLDRRRTLHLVISSMPNALLIIDDQNRLSALFIPPGFPYIWKGSDLFGDLHLDDLVPDGMAGKLEAMIAGVRESWSVHTDEIAFELDGELLWLDIKVSPVTSSHDVLVVMDNITARKQAEAERERLIEDLDAFAHTVAHDLKNPLSSVLGYAELLGYSLDDVLSEEDEGYLETVIRNAHKMESIIDALLLLASVRKLEDVQVHPIDMTAIVTEIRHRMARLIQEYDAEIVAPDSWPGVLGHTQWIEEVVGNYVSNAIKYGSRPPRVELGSEMQDDGAVRFWVRDNGPGLSPEDQTKLFTQFMRLDQSDVEGHGLGLSIVRRIVEKLGGKVGIESEVGQGSTFFFTLPAAEQEAKAS